MARNRPNCSVNHNRPRGRVTLGATKPFIVRSRSPALNVRYFVRHEVALGEWCRGKATPRRVSKAGSQSLRASPVTVGCEAGGNAQGASEPSGQTRPGKAWTGERE